MARPRIFVSSTYYDLKHIRSSLEIFIQSLGYDAILSEKGDIAYTPDTPLDESCYREAQNSDIYVLIIGGRYGSEISGAKSEAEKDFFERYESITKQEYKSAAGKDIPIYILIEKPVYSEYQTFRKNRDSKNIKYAHVDSVNIFYFIEEILAQTRNNPIHTFDRHAEIELWLKEQWAGLFRELIQRMSSQQQLASLSTQISGLSEINQTLKKYLEALLVSEAPKKSRELISKEDRRLKEVNKASILRSSSFIEYLHRSHGVDIDTIYKHLLDSARLDDFLAKVSEETGKTGFLKWSNDKHAETDYWLSRRALGLSVPLDVEPIISPPDKIANAVKVSNKTISSKKIRSTKKAAATKKVKAARKTPTKN